MKTGKDMKLFAAYYPPASDNTQFGYLAYAKFCAVSEVTGGPVEEMNGIPVPAQLIYEQSRVIFAEGVQAALRRERYEYPENKLHPPAATVHGNHRQHGAEYGPKTCEVSLR